ncbi:MAG: SRPBCC domain-containing protein [Flavobacteriia bacterium]|jgi:carbon monoxide dehydrogenase subunit G
MVIESNKVIVNQNIQTVFDFLKDTNNIVELLPQDKISDWKSDELNCSFKVQGGIIISFEQVNLEEPTKIFLKSGQKAPFPFTLTIFLEEKGTETEGFLKFDGEVNMFLKMMVQGPLEHLFNFMSDKLKAKYA